MIKTIRAGLLGLLVLAQTAAAQTSFPEDTDRYVIDHAQLLSDEQQAALRTTLEDLYDARDIEFTVLTISQMSDYGHTGAIEPFATALFNHWGIGDAERNDGVLLLVSRFDRKLRIEVGAGYGDTLDGPMKRVIDKNIVPYFREDDYPKGIEVGVNQIIYQITDRYPGEYNSPWLERVFNGVKRLLTTLGLWLLAPFGLVVPFVVRFYRRWMRNRPRICPNDLTQMRRCLEETEDDELSPGQLVEERLESVDYDVWYCNKCDHVKVDAYKAWFSKYGACRECNFRTVEGDTRTIRSATYNSTGLRETKYNCHHCDAHYTVQRTIPRKTKSSSSSGSSRGGGRSSGGGASGSW